MSGFLRPHPYPLPKRIWGGVFLSVRVVVRFANHNPDTINMWMGTEVPCPYGNDLLFGAGETVIPDCITPDQEIFNSFIFQQSQEFFEVAR